MFYPLKNFRLQNINFGQLNSELKAFLPIILNTDINDIHSKFKNVRKLKTVRSSKETWVFIGWALPRVLVAMVTSDILRLSYIL